MTDIFCLLNNENNIIFKNKDIINSFNHESLFEYNFKNLKDYYKLQILINKNYLSIDGIEIISNGIIYNYSELYTLLNITPTTSNSYEIIIHLYKVYGIKQTLNIIDGSFSFILIDNRISNKETNCKVYICKDPFGTIPIYFFKIPINNNYIYAISSNLQILKKLYSYSNDYSNNYLTEYNTFKSSSYSYFILEIKALSYWELKKQNKIYYIPNNLNLQTINEDFFNKTIHYLNQSIIKKYSYTKTFNNAFLLTSDITNIFLAYYFIQNKINITFFIIGIENSNNFIYIKKVADFLNIKYVEIKISTSYFNETYSYIENNLLNTLLNGFNSTNYNKNFSNLLNEEKQEKVFLYLFSKHLKDNTNINFIYSCFGGNEIFAISKNEKIIDENIFLYDKNIRSRLKNISKSFDYIYFFNCMNNNNINIIFPFLDKNFINFYLSTYLILKNNEELFLFFEKTKINKDNKKMLSFLDYNTFLTFNLLSYFPFDIPK
jgi:asparagine synthetase B (glutamine-hydrolysing)